MSNLRRRFVDAIYATHNSSPAIEQAINRCLESIKSGEVGLNVGSGATRIHERILNLDIIINSQVDCLAFAEQLPFKENSIRFVMTQETIEHVRDPYGAIEEIYRVLEEGGIIYFQVPFVIGYHPGPTDFWRFSVEGVRELLERAGFVCDEISIAVGPATGFYRILVEFWAVLFSSFWSRLYYPIKGLSALVFYPIKWLDSLLLRSKQADRIAGGYYVIAHK